MYSITWNFSGMILLYWAMTDNTVLPSILFLLAITFYFSQQKKFEDTVDINYRLPIKVYYRICTLRHIRIEINHVSQNVS
jgi:hypothetical protein